MVDRIGKGAKTAAWTVQVLLIDNKPTVSQLEVPAELFNSKYLAQLEKATPVPWALRITAQQLFDCVRAHTATRVSQDKRRELPLVRALDFALCSRVLAAANAFSFKPCGPNSAYDDRTNLVAEKTKVHTWRDAEEPWLRLIDNNITLELSVLEDMQAQQTLRIPYGFFTTDSTVRQCKRKLLQTHPALQAAAVLWDNDSVDDQNIFSSPYILGYRLEPGSILALDLDMRVADFLFQHVAPVSDPKEQFLSVDTELVLAYSTTNTPAHKPIFDFPPEMDIPEVEPVPGELDPDLGLFGITEKIDLLSI